MNRLIAVLLITFIPIILKAQEPVYLQIGKRGIANDVSQKSATNKIESPFFKNDPSIYVSATSQPYAIKKLEVSILPEDGELLGPFTIKGEEQLKLMQKHLTHLSTGTRIFYENIMLDCEGCITDQTLKTYNLVVLLE